jgi:hypothetical protein
MVLAVLPIIYTLRLPRWKAALAVGAILWLVGGCAGLLVPSTVMVPTQRYIHIVEIFTQNFSLGVTAVWLLRPRAAKTKVAKGGEQGSTGGSAEIRTLFVRFQKNQLVAVAGATAGAAAGAAAELSLATAGAWAGAGAVSAVGAAFLPA